MRFGTVSVSRAAYYDRTASGVANASNTGGAAPHTATTRFTYTVPAARKSNLGACQCRCNRASVAGAPGNPQVDIVYTPSGGSAKNILDAFLAATNVAGDMAFASNVGGITMIAGDTIQMIDSDNSTTGTVIFQGSFVATEFDA